MKQKITASSACLKFARMGSPVEKSGSWPKTKKCPGTPAEYVFFISQEATWSNLTEGSSSTPMVPMSEALLGIKNLPSPTKFTSCAMVINKW